MLVTTAPLALFIGVTANRSVRSRITSASLPGVSVPTLRSSALARAPSMVAKLDHVARGQQLGQVLLAGERTHPNIVVLKRQDGAHLREQIARYRGFHIDRERRPQPE